MDKIEIINTIKAQRIEQGKSLQTIADKVNTSKADIFKIEKEYISIGLDKLIKIADALQLDITIQPKQ